MILDPRGYAQNEVIQWADMMAGHLGFFPSIEQGADYVYERLDDPDDWQDWAAGVFGGTDPLGQDVPDPFDYDNWKEWAERMFATTNFTG